MSAVIIAAARRAGVRGLDDAVRVRGEFHTIDLLGDPERVAFVMARLRAEMTYRTPASLNDVQTAMVSRTELEAAVAAEPAAAEADWLPDNAFGILAWSAV